MKKYFLGFTLLIILLNIGTAFGQNENTSEEKKEERTAFILKFSPFSMADPLSPAFQFAGEYPISERMSMQTEAGLIFGNSVDHKNIFGIRARQELRFYLSPLSKYLCRGPYVGFDVMYKYQDNGTQQENVPIDNDPNIPGTDYWELRDVKQLDRAMTFQFRAGSQHVFTDKNSFFNRIVFDWSVGFGIRRIFELSSDFMDYEANSFRRAYSLNVRVGYLFNK